VQAIEVGPGPGGDSATPIPVSSPAAEAAGNLLANPGFEDGAVGTLGALGARGGGFGWNYLFASPSQSYIWGESAYSIHPDWGLPVLHRGKEALRTHTEGNGHTVVYQEVEVRPDTRYTASVWVRADDLHGQGFGTQPGDSAGLWIQEFNEGGGLVADHPKVAVTKAGEYQKLTLPFTTSAATAKVRFILDTVIGCKYDQGHVTYDDCALIREDSGG
jgi:hypothetical protein